MIVAHLGIGLPFWRGTLVDACAANRRCEQELKPEKSWLPGGKVDHSDGQSREFREQLPLILIAGPCIYLLSNSIYWFVGGLNGSPKGLSTAVQAAKVKLHPVILGWRVLTAMLLGYMLYRSELVLLLLAITVVWGVCTLIQAARLWLFTAPLRSPQAAGSPRSSDKPPRSAPPTSIAWILLLWLGPLAVWVLTTLTKLLAESNKRQIGFYWIHETVHSVLAFLIGRYPATAIAEFVEPFTATLELDRGGTPWFLFYGMVFLRLISWAMDAHWAVTEHILTPRARLAGRSPASPTACADKTSDLVTPGHASEHTRVVPSSHAAAGSTQRQRRLSGDEYISSTHSEQVSDDHPQPSPSGNHHHASTSTPSSSPQSSSSSSPPAASSSSSSPAAAGSASSDTASPMRSEPASDTASPARNGSGQGRHHAPSGSEDGKSCLSDTTGLGYRERVRVSHPLSDYGLEARDAAHPTGSSALASALRLWSSWLSLVAFCLYAPTSVAGPISTFNAWLSQVKVPQVTYRGYALAKVVLRAAALVLCFEVALHYVPFFSVTKHGAYAGFGPAAISKLGYTAIVMLWLKFAAIWATMRVWAIIDGVETPDNMGRCVSNNFSLVEFWKSWHRSFNMWLVRYVYVPLGGNRVGVPMQVVNTALVFMFVALWHDVNPELLIWGGLIGVLFVPEFCAKALVARGGMLAWMRAEWWFRYAVAMASALNIFVMIVPNVVGYTKMGKHNSIPHMLWVLLVTGGDDASDPGGLSLLVVIFVLLGVAANIMLWIRSHEELTYGATKENWKVDLPTRRTAPTSAQIAATDAVIAAAAASRADRSRGSTVHATKGN